MKYRFDDELLRSDCDLFLDGVDINVNLNDIKQEHLNMDKILPGRCVDPDFIAYMEALGYQYEESVEFEGNACFDVRFDGHQLELNVFDHNCKYLLELRTEHLDEEISL